MTIPVKVRTAAHVRHLGVGALHIGCNRARAYRRTANIWECTVCGRTDLTNDDVVQHGEALTILAIWAISKVLEEG